MDRGTDGWTDVCREFLEELLLEHVVKRDSSRLLLHKSDKLWGSPSLTWGAIDNRHGLLLCSPAVTLSQVSEEGCPCVRGGVRFEEEIIDDGVGVDVEFAL